MNDVIEIAKALNAFQAELVTVAKDADNPFFRSKYADLASIMKATQPVLTKHGLAVVQLPSTTADGKPALTTIVMHTSGDSIESTVPLILAKQDPQGLGSAITYMRRYAYAAALQIVIDEDDDGNSAVQSQPSFTAVPDRARPQQRGLRDIADNSPASQLQKETIMKYLDKLGVSKEESVEYLKSEYGVVGALTRQKAKEVIDDLIRSDEP